MKRILLTKYAFCFLFFISFVLLNVSSWANDKIESTDSNATLNRLFAYARSHDTSALERLKPEIESESNSTYSKAYSLALYIAAPEKYEAQFVDNFPTDTNGIMYDLYENIELKQYTPSFLYSMNALGSIALKGNEKAMKKVFIGTSHSDGAVGEAFCDYVEKLFDKNLLSTLTVLSQLDPTERNGTYECFKLMEHDDVAVLKNKINQTKTKDKMVLQIIQEINHISLPTSGSKGSGR